MKIEEILKTNTNLPIAKKAVVSLLYTYNIVNSALNDALKPYKISIQQFNVLRILRGQKGKPVSLATVQECMINKMSNTTRLIDKLVTKGFVEKEINIENKRKIDISVTNKGLELLIKVDNEIDTIEEKIVSNLDSTETHKLIGLLGKIRLIAN